MLPVETSVVEYKLDTCRFDVVNPTQFNCPVLTTPVGYNLIRPFAFHIPTLTLFELLPEEL
jgi:hypothetical protein